MIATYKINGLPIGFAWLPPIIPYWLIRLKIKGRKVGGIVSFTMEEVKEGLKKDKVEHIADFLGNKNLWFDAEDCEQEIDIQAV